MARNTLDSDIVDAINNIDKFELWDNPTNCPALMPSGSITEIHGTCYFKQERENKTLYDMFYDNIHVHASVSENERIFSVRVKNPSEIWKCPFDGERMVTDFSHTANEDYEVYVWYLLPILDISNIDGHIYKSGSWDKYIYKNMKKFFETVNKETDTSKFNGYYK